MPKIVDAEEARHQIAKAACKAIAQKGISDVTMVDIARAAGVTTGMITNYFASKTEIIAAALRIPFANVKKKIERLMANGETDLSNLLEVVIPASRDHYEDVAVWINFWGLIASSEEFRKLNGFLHREGSSIYKQAVLQTWPESGGWPSDVFDTALRSIITFLFGLCAGGVTNLKTWTPAVQRNQLKLHLHFVRTWAQSETLRRSKKH